LRVLRFLSKKRLKNECVLAKINPSSLKNECVLRYFSRRGSKSDAKMSVFLRGIESRISLNRGPRGSGPGLTWSGVNSGV